MPLTQPETSEPMGMTELSAPPAPLCHGIGFSTVSVSLPMEWELVEDASRDERTGNTRANAFSLKQTLLQYNTPINIKKEPEDPDNCFLSIPNYH